MVLSGFSKHPPPGASISINGNVCHQSGNGAIAVWDGEGRLEKCESEEAEENFHEICIDRRYWFADNRGWNRVDGQAQEELPSSGQVTCLGSSGHLEITAL